MRSAIALPASPPAIAPAAAPTTVPTGPATEPAAAPAAMPPAAAPMPVPTGCAPGLPEIGSRLASAPSFLLIVMGNDLLSGELRLGIPMPPRVHKGADALVSALAAHGVRRIFALSGNHVMPVFDATLDAGIEIVHVRHEAATVHMADAFARVSGEVGVALVTGGPGHANAIGALYTAAMAEAPVLLLSGHAPLAELGRGAFQEMRQAELAAPLTKSSRVAMRPQSLAADVARAMHEARSGQPGPVHLSLPTDVLEASVEQVPSRVPAAKHGLMNMSHVASRLANAARPLVLCGPALM